MCAEDQGLDTEREAGWFRNVRVKGIVKRKDSSWDKM